MHFSLGRLYTNALLASLNARRKFRSNPVELTPLAVVPRPRALSTVLTESTNEQDVSLYHIEVISPHHIALVIDTAEGKGKNGQDIAA
ncbi:hypothetical protein CVT26_003507 [Gymnopilus dilepis]|uniref:Uncharacterized protein n=1 Tax=Gymnopilus dilepis TaxID=231916 RepID=A0A409W325_9AGAR|nr:hypothetical protein CVT26_003507 [Gymnopilus dilepis]